MLLLRLLLKIWNNLAIFFNIVFILLKLSVGGHWRPPYYEDISYTATTDDYHGYRKKIYNYIICDPYIYHEIDYWFTFLYCLGDYYYFFLDDIHFLYIASNSSTTHCGWAS